MVSSDNSASRRLYPRVYRASGGWLVFVGVCAAVSILVASVNAWWFVIAEPPRDLAGRIGMWCFSCVFLGLGIYLLLSIFRSRVVLFDDRIEVVELTSTKILRRNEIRGWKWTPAPGLAFFPNDPRRASVSFAQVFPIDAEFDEWLGTLPCLNTDRRRTSRIEIRNNPRLGPTPGHRMKALAKGKRIAFALNSIACIVSLWAFVQPVPYEPLMAALIATPWLAGGAVFLSRGLFRIDGFQNDDHPHVAFAILAPTGILALRSALDYEMLDWQTIAWYAVSAGLILWLYLCGIDPNSRASRGTVAALLLFSLMHGYGTAVQANALLDRSPERSYDAVVVAKHVESRSATTYRLALRPWGPDGMPTRVRVGYQTYRHVQPGNLVHLAVRDGALRARWYRIRSWERGSGPLPLP